MSDINIRELTTAAEEGHGCAVSSALQSVDFIEAMKVLKQIAEQNVKDTDNDASQTHLWVKTNSQDSLASAKLLARTPEEFSFQVEFLAATGFVIADYGSHHFGDRPNACMNWDHGDSKAKP
jgi:hypothetical protein